MRLASKPRNLRLPKLAARSKKVRKMAQEGVQFLSNDFLYSAEKIAE